MEERNEKNIFKSKYYNNNYYGTAQVLPNKGNVKILVVPVWFNDSNVFFNTSQKEQNPKTDYERLTFVEKTIFNAGGVISNNANGNPMAVFNNASFMSPLS